MKNPLLQYRFTTPRETFPFPDISVSDIEAAMHKGMELERSEVDVHRAIYGRSDFSQHDCGADLHRRDARTRHYAHVQPTFGQHVR